MNEYFYSPATGETYSVDQMLALFGIEAETDDIAVLNASGFYPVIPTEPDFDVTLYDVTYVWSIVPYGSGLAAERVYSPVPKTLLQAQANGSSSVKAHAQSVINNWSETTGYTIDMLTPVAAQLAVNRPARFASQLDILQAYSEVLDRQLDWIDSATTVDEINEVVNPPAITGEVTVNSTGNDLDDSFVNTITGVPAADLSLYFPSTDTTVAYDTGTSKFPATVGVFAGGDYAGIVRYLGVYNLAVFDASAPPVTVTIDWTYDNY